MICRPDMHGKQYFIRYYAPSFFCTKHLFKSLIKTNVQVFITYEQHIFAPPPQSECAIQVTLAKHRYLQVKYSKRCKTKKRHLSSTHVVEDLLLRLLFTTVFGKPVRIPGVVPLLS